ncbi:MAG: HepT-like ribonuclease domain-containing protein [Desulfobacterales bacterium]
MCNKVIKENLEGIAESIELIARRFSSVRKPDDFVLNTDGVLLLDSICMRLQIIGELLKNIHKNNQDLLPAYPEINRPSIMKLRDIISHHYEHVDFEMVYDICENHIPPLQRVIQLIMDEYPRKPAKT